MFLLASFMALAPAVMAAYPDAPTGLNATPGDGQVALSWTAPAFDEADPIDHYEVYQDTINTELDPTGTSVTVTSLTNNVPYSFTVAAFYSISGEGYQSAEASATPTPTIVLTAPSAPQSLGATASTDRITLTWAAPASDGGSTITGYTIYRGTSSGGETLLTTTGDVLTYADTAVSSGSTYYYEVTATNSVGESGRSNEASATVPTAVTAPSAPRDLAAEAGDGRIVLTWTAPASTGGAAIDYYVVYQDDVQIAAPVSTSIDLTGLTNDQAYKFNVAAHNSAGQGPNSTQISATPIAEVTAPTVPLGVQATPGDGQVTITWMAPTNDGGASIDYYIVYQDDTEVARPTGTSATITNLANGVEHNFTVAAHNSVGIGQRSAAVAVTPSATVTIPGAPTGLEVTPGDGEAYLYWAAPGNNGGAEIDHYVVYRDGVDVAHVNETSFTASSLTNGRSYSFTVAAHNSAGDGPNSSAAAVTPSPLTSAPGAPTSVKITPGDGQVTITWKAPANEGSSPIDHYIVYLDGVEVAHPTGTSVTIADLTNGQEYRFMIAAHNAVGKGAMTTTYKATPSNPSIFSDMTNVLLILVFAALVVVIILGLLLLVRRNATLPPHQPSDPRGELANDAPAAPAPPAAPPAASPRISAPPPVVIAPATAAAEKESVLCPRCGRPSSGPTCKFCGKKIRRKR